MPDKKFDLGDYVEVKDRIAIFYELYPKGSLVTGSPELMMVDGKPYLLLQAYAYRTPDDPHPGVGTSWMAIPGSTTYTRGSEAENVETSAWGRAIGSLGILIDKSIASAQEVQNKQEDGPRIVTVGTTPVDVTKTDDGGLIGTAIAQGTQDFELRQTPTGYTLPFRVKDGSKSFIVLAEKDMASTIAAFKPTIIGQRVTVWGHWTTEVIPAKGNKPAITYRVLHLERMQTPDGMLTANASGDGTFTDYQPEVALPEPPEDVPLLGEAESAPLGLT